MKGRHPLNVHLTLSNVGDDPAEHGYDDNYDNRVIRDVSLIVLRQSPNDPPCLVFTEPKQATPSLTATPRELVPSYVSRIAQNCFAKWQSALLDNVETRESPNGVERSRPFCDNWCLRGRDEELLRRQMGLLAVAGHDLFYALFFESNDDELKKIGERLKELSRSGTLNITVESDEFFVPWRMLYVHPDPEIPLHEPDGSNYDLRGFWGYTHTVEHNPRKIQVDLFIQTGKDNTVVGSINYDERVDAGFKVEVMKPHLAKMLKVPQWPTPVLRKQKDEFIAAISDTTFQEQILYFFCHGESWGDPTLPQTALPHLKLTDAEPIYSSDIESRRKTPFSPNPLIFINSCQAGQASGYAYEALAPTFLKRHALSVIAPQINIPALFAAEFAERFFRELFTGNSSPRIAKLVRNLTRQFLDECCNPFGLAYNVYRGIDCYVRQTGKAVAKKEKSK